MRWRRILLAIAACCLTASAMAHDFIVVRAAVVVDGATVTVTVLVAQGDLLMALGEKRMAFADAAELRTFAPRIAQYLISDTHLRVDGAELPLRYLGPILLNGSDLPPQLTLALRGEAASPPATTALRLDLFGEQSTPLIATVEMRAADTVERRTVGRGETVEVGAPRTGSQWGESAPDRPLIDWLRLGFGRVVPNGLQYLFFLIGLLVLAPRLKPLLAQVIAFCVAQSSAMGWSALGGSSLPLRVLEPLIAMSILYVAIDNLACREPRPWRWLAVIAFGIVHGLRLGAAFSSYLPDHELGPAVLTMCGVTAAELTVLVAAAAVTSWCRRRAWYRRAIVIPASAVIASFGIMLAAQACLMPRPGQAAVTSASVR